jgi:DNA-binding NtrC family response regulator
MLAGSSVSVLIHGETGTGKELIARALHEQGPRKEHPFVVVDCGSLPPTLISSELFGHERGAFTGADARHEGAFERADGGTVFLDEIGELPLAVQPALLGVLERRKFRRVGGDKEIPVDVRIVSATHRDLRSEANRGNFRADLYFRMAVARIVNPPLRDRREDIPELVAHFVREVTGDADAQPFSPATLDALKAHPWSGNVRELRNVVESALAMGGMVMLDAEGGGGSVRVDLGDIQPYREARAEVLAAFEQRYFSRLLEQAGTNVSKAARLAKMDRPYLTSVLKRLKLR